MKCNRCQTQAVQNTAGGKEFWYCRKCKDEVFDQPITIQIRTGGIAMATGTVVQAPVRGVFRRMVPHVGSPSSATYKPVPVVFPMPAGRAIPPLNAKPPPRPSWYVPRGTGLEFDLFKPCYGTSPQASDLTVADWIPVVAPGPNDNFLGINRYLDTVRFSGSRLTGSMLPIEEQFVKLSTHVAREGGSPTVAFLCEPDFNAFNNTLGHHGTTGDSFQYPGPMNLITVYRDDDVPKGLLYLLNPKTWVYDIEIQNLVCLSPWENGVTTL